MVIVIGTPVFFLRILIITLGVVETTDRVNLGTKEKLIYSSLKVVLAYFKYSSMHLDMRTCTK